MHPHERALAWARSHIDVVNEDIKRFEKDQEGPLVAESDSLPGEYLVKRARFIPPLDEHWVFRIGDAIHGMRVSLDYLACSIVRPSGAREMEGTAFPICRADSGKTPNWGSYSNTTLPSLNPDIVKAFYDLQPCSGTGDGRYHMLTMLDKLENVHKHRKPLDLGASSFAQGFTLTGPNNFEIVDRFAFSADMGAPVYRVRLTDAGDNGPHAKFQAPVRVCFDKNGPALGRPVADLLDDLHKHIRDVIFQALGRFV